MKTLDKLILGQTELNRRTAEVERKRSEIKMIVGMILGVMPRVGAALKEREPLYLDGARGLTWYVGRESNRYYAGCRNIAVRLFSTDSRDFPLHNVEPVYESLSEFVDQMFARFPILNEHLRKILDAADSAA